jgi:hypothetical protein
MLNKAKALFGKELKTKTNLHLQIDYIENTVLMNLKTYKSTKPTILNSLSLLHALENAVLNLAFTLKNN